MAERVALAQQNNAIRINDAIKQIIARDNLEQVVSPVARMPAPEGVDLMFTCRHFVVA